MYYLLIGGPAHGQEREVDNGQNDLIVMAPSNGNPIPTPFTYERKTVQAETTAGFVYERTLFVEKGMPLELATQALAAILLQNFAQELVRQYMEGGVPVGIDKPESEPDRPESSRLLRA